MKKKIIVLIFIVLVLIILNILFFIKFYKVNKIISLMKVNNKKINYSYSIIINNNSCLVQEFFHKQLVVNF